RDRRSWQNTGENRVAAGGHDAARKGFLELGARAAGVAADEDAATLRPERGRPAQALHEPGRQVFPDDPPDPVGTEVAAGQLALGELRRLARLVQPGLLALDDARVAREEACPLQRHTQLRVGLDEGTRDPVTDGARLAAWSAPVQSDPD